jgi:hypothetical protein
MSGLGRLNDLLNRQRARLFPNRPCVFDTLCVLGGGAKMVCNRVNGTGTKLVVCLFRLSSPKTATILPIEEPSI